MPTPFRQHQETPSMRIIGSPLIAAAALSLMLGACGGGGGDSDSEVG